MANKTQNVSAPEVRWPQSPEDTAAVRAQLERILGDPLFNQSRRYPTLLRRIVEESLAGNFDSLKERVLGTELFDRAPDYDTNADAIVRVTAAEIRKRIAQYYHEKEHASEVRIDLPVGGYVAEFSLPEIVQVLSVATEVDGTQSVSSAQAESPLDNQHRKSSISWRVLFAGIAVLIGVAVFTLFVHSLRHDEAESFWQPFTSSGTRPLVCVGQLPIIAQQQGPQDSLSRTLLSQRPVSISDAVVVAQYATFLGTKNVYPRIQVSTATSYTDIRHTPILLVGGLDNNWTLRFLSTLRYRMKTEPNSSIVQVYDSTNPSAVNWKMDFALQSEHVAEDYAIVARFYAPSTESTVVIAAGLGENGTSAAADFIVHSQYLRQIDAQSPLPWKNRNMELVLKTQIIDGNAGPPVIVAKYFW